MAHPTKGTYALLLGLMFALQVTGASEKDLVKAKATCDSMTGRKIAASSIGLPTSGATVVSATVIPAAPQAVSGNPTTLAIPEYCKVVGTISPVDPTAPLINFQANMPTSWNRKTIQLGGSGTNGSIPGALNGAPQNGPESLPPDSPYAISRGFVVYGSDSGHQNPPGGGRGAPPQPPGPQDNAYMSNREALINYGYAQMKKTHDVVKTLIKTVYGVDVRHSYYMGSSQGGREALMVAQRFPQDYDGVFSQVPIYPFTHLIMDTTLRARLQTGDGWIPPAKVAAIANEVARQCDELDGIKDGLEANYVACNDRFDPAKNPNAFSAIRCPEGKDTGDTCLSDAQIKSANQVHATVTYPYPLANGWTSIPGWTTGSESAGNWKAFPNRPTQVTPAQGMLKTFAPGREVTMDTPLEDYRAGLQELSAMFDASNPDLGAFRKRGGKLILKVNTADYTADSRWSFAYFDKMVEMMGKSVVDEFARFYVAVGLFHNGNLGTNPLTKEPVPHYIDFIGMLDDWVDGNKPPAEQQVVRDMKPTPPFETVSSLPLCRYPQYPRYSGNGDPKKAESYACSMP
jgi:hypothetical protein